MSPTRVFLIRHGETEWNREKRFRGRADIALNAKGRAQAEALGRYFSTVPLTAIHSSGQKRALDTAKAVAKGQPEDRFIHTEEGFADIHRGEWEGLAHDAARKRYPELYQKWFSSPAEVHFPGGESLREVERRLWTAFDRVSRVQEGGAVAIVSHHVVLRVLLGAALGVELNRFRQFAVAPASVSELRLEYGSWVLERLNDVSFLGELRSED